MLGNHVGRTKDWRKPSAVPLGHLYTGRSSTFDLDLLPDEIRTYLAEHWACVVCRRFIHDNPGPGRLSPHELCPAWGAETMHVRVNHLREREREGEHMIAREVGVSFSSIVLLALPPFSFILLGLCLLLALLFLFPLPFHRVPLARCCGLPLLLLLLLPLFLLLFLLLFFLLLLLPLPFRRFPLAWCCDLLVLSPLPALAAARQRCSSLAGPPKSLLHCQFQRCPQRAPSRFSSMTAWPGRMVQPDQVSP